MSKYYIARNKDNTLRAFSNKPSKNGWNFWDAVNDFLIKLKESWFPEVKWEDKEPKVLTIEESPWIKVEDRLPDVGDNVLLMCKHNYIYYFASFSYSFLHNFILFKSSLSLL